MERRSVFFYVVVAIVVVFIIALSTLVILKVTYDGCEDFERICLNPECIQAAAQILDYLDTTVNPCTNFYAFACGNFLSSVEIPENKNYVSTIGGIYEELQKQLKEMLEEPMYSNDANYIKILKTYYQACNNVVAIEQLGLDAAKQILEQVGGWPVLDGPDWKGYDDLDWYDYIYKLKEVGLDTDYLVTLSLTNSKENSSLRMITVDVPRLNIPSSDRTLNTLGEFRKIYYPYMISVAKIFGAPESRAVDELNHSLEFEINLNHCLTANEAPLVLTVSEFNDKFPNIPWFAYIRTLMFPYAVITKNEKILVTSPGYIKSLDNLLTKTSKRVQANYIMWRAIQTLIPYLNEELIERTFAYESAIYDFSEKPPRWQQCIRESYNRFPIPLSSFYIQNYFEVNTKEKATILTNLIKDQFVDVLKTSLKIRSTFRDSFVTRISEMMDFLAYPDNIRHVQWIDDMYAKLKVDTDDYLHSYLNINIRNRELFIKSLRQPITPENLFNNRIIAELHTSYNPLENSLSVSAGSLQGLLFNTNHPDYLNYGGIGFTIAQEIVRAFDWSKAEVIDLEKRECFINQYNSFTVLAIDEQLNGTVSLDKNIADNVGLRIAYITYQKLVEKNGPQKRLAALEYTPNQLFWISFAVNQCSKEKLDFMSLLIGGQENIPAEFRVIGVLANLDEFSNDFNCATESSMNPLNKCLIW